MAFCNKKREKKSRIRITEEKQAYKGVEEMRDMDVKVMEYECGMLELVTKLQNVEILLALKS